MNGMEHSVVHEAIVKVYFKFFIYILHLSSNISKTLLFISSKNTAQYSYLVMSNIVSTFYYFYSIE